jgi:hypothetical protein
MSTSPDSLAGAAVLALSEELVAAPNASATSGRDAGARLPELQLRIVDVDSSAGSAVLPRENWPTRGHRPAC